MRDLISPPVSAGLKAWLWARRRLVFSALGSASVALLAISCSTVSRTVLAPPSIPGATFVGSKACADCHEELVRDFKTATHARLTSKSANAVEAGCESCHGPGSLHVESGGEAHTIINPKKSAETCFQCHLDARSRFSLPSHHPVDGRRLSCGDCHDSHKGPAIRGGETSLMSENESCLQCHQAQRGPHVFEHEAMREGCVACHEPHGSVNSKLLRDRNANLCLKCHFQQQTGAGRILIGGMDHSGLLARGTCWTAGCHEAVHGSQVNSSLRY